MEWRFDPIEGHVTEDLTRIRHLMNHGREALRLLFPNSPSARRFSTASAASVPPASPPTAAASFWIRRLRSPVPCMRVERFFSRRQGRLPPGAARPWGSAPKGLGLKVLKRHEAAARNLIKEYGIPRALRADRPQVARGLHHGKKKSWDHFNDLCAPLRDMGVEPIVFPSPHEGAEVKAACPDARILRRRPWGTTPRSASSPPSSSRMTPA